MFAQVINVILAAVPNRAPRCDQQGKTPNSLDRDLGPFSYLSHNCTLHESADKGVILKGLILSGQRLWDRRSGYRPIRSGDR